jgi:hypothetical protein
VKSLDDRRVYEVIAAERGEAGSGRYARITDFEGRSVVRGGEVTEDFRWSIGAA